MKVHSISLSNCCPTRLQTIRLRNHLPYLGIYLATPRPPIGRPALSALWCISECGSSCTMNRIRGIQPGDKRNREDTATDFELGFLSVNFLLLKCVLSLDERRQLGIEGLDKTYKIAYRALRIPSTSLLTSSPFSSAFPRCVDFNSSPFYCPSPPSARITIHPALVITLAAQSRKDIRPVIKMRSLHSAVRVDGHVFRTVSAW